MTAGVYLIRSVAGLTKIGKSTHIRARFLALQHASPVDLSIIHVIETVHGDAIERALHARYRTRRERGEWCALSHDDIAAIRALDVSALRMLVGENTRDGLTAVPADSYGVVLRHLRQVREARKLSRDDLAARASMAPSTIALLERGRAARYGTIRKLARALRVKPAQLVGDEPSGDQTTR